MGTSLSYFWQHHQRGQFTMWPVFLDWAWHKHGGLQAQKTSAQKAEMIICHPVGGIYHLNTSRNMSQNVSRNVFRNNHLSSSRGYTYITSEYEWSLDRKTPEWLVASPAGWPQLSTKSTLIWWFWWWYRWSWSTHFNCSNFALQC